MNPNTVSVSVRLRALLLFGGALLALLLLRPAPVSAGVVACAGSPYTVLTAAELNDAIGCVNSAGAGSHEIMLQADILLPASTPAINNALATSIIIDGNSLYEVDGQDISGVRPFTIAPSTTVTLQNLTVTGGNASSGGGIYNEGTLTVTNSTFSANQSFDGGAIYNRGSLALTGSTISGSTATFFCGGIYNEGTLTVTNSTLSGNTAEVGGGVCNFAGTLALTNSTVSGNTATGNGGGVFSNDTMTMTNSTVSGNSAGSAGGGIYNNQGTLTVTNSTVSGNSAGSFGGGIQSFATLSIHNSIIANSTSGGDCSRFNGTVSASHSLIEDGLGCVDGTSTNNLTGDPALGTLAYNGGPTQTHALGAGSVAIDAGLDSLALDASSSPLTTDQRGTGFPRIVGTAVDMGAFEVQCPPFPRSVATAAELNDAIACYNALAAAGTYQITLTAAIDLTASTTVINNATTNVALVIEGGGYTVDGQDISGVRPFTIAPSTTVTLQNLTVTGGNASEGGGVYNSGTLTMTSSTISGNAADGGGGIYNNQSTLTMTNSTVSGNSTGFYGGGIYNNQGTLTMTNSTVSGNSTGFYGGGVYNLSPSIPTTGTLTMSNSTVSGNSTGYYGGVYKLWASITTTGTVTMTNSTVTGNSAGEFGGGIMSFGTLSIYNSIIANSASGGDCFRSAGTINASHSLIEDGLGCVNGTSTNNLTGDPDLGPLQGNGGPTPTHMPAAAGPAAGAADNAVCAAAPVSGLDQRGVPRPQGAVCDMGAVEITAQAALGGTVALQGRATPGTPGLVTVVDTNGIMPNTAVPFDAATGAFSFTSVPVSAPSTPYELTAGHGLYLSNQFISIVLPAGNVDTGSTLLKAGDANNDGTINILDLGCMGGAYQTLGSSCGGLGGTDLNADGITNILDLALAGGNYNLTSPQPW